MHSITKLVRNHFYFKPLGSNFCISNPLLLMGGVLFNICACILLAFFIETALSGEFLTFEEQDLIGSLFMESQHL